MTNNLKRSTASRKGGRFCTLRWCIETDDRIGMVRDIVSEIANLSGNLEAMEVVLRFVYVRLSIEAGHVAVLQEKLAGVQGVREIHPIDRMPFEADEQTLIRRVMHQEGDASSLSFFNLSAKSEAMQRVIEMAKTVAVGDAPVLITGETGTGKELLARAIHQASSRNHRRFVPLNCAAIPEALLESELFGYVEGAFTGAQRGGRPGLFEIADEGTLFLDEVGEMNPSVQAKVLRVLADGEVRRVGSNETRKVSVRILAATNRNLNDMVGKGTFREDLFYRLNVIPLHIPPLRERREDILPIAIRFLESMARKFERDFFLTEEAKSALIQYDFPGNVRELQNMIERACYLNRGVAMTPQHLSLGGAVRAKVQPPLMGGLQDRTAEAPSMEKTVSAKTLRERVRAYEIAIIREAVQETGSLRGAAKRLGTTHTALGNKLRAFEQTDDSE